MNEVSQNMETVHAIHTTPAICHCSSIIADETGAMCVWYEGSYETASDTVLKISRRSESGVWCNAETLFDFHGAPLGNPVLWRGPGGSLEIIFSVLTGASWRFSLLFYASSRNRGRRWTRPSLLLARPGFMAKTQPVVSPDGRMLVPLYHEEEYCPYILIVDDLEDPRGGSLIAETMARGKAIQPTLCTLGEERYLMLCRTNQGTVWRSLSCNGGLSWSILRPTTLPNPDSAIDSAAWRGVVLLCYNPSERQRDELRLAASFDHGVQWRDLAIIARGDGEYSYPCIYRDAADTLHITYTDNRYAIRAIHLDAATVERLLETPQLP